MALLGFHTVLSLISVSLLQRFSARYSLGRRLLSRGLFRFLHPTTEELRQAAGLGQVKLVKGKARQRHNGEQEPSHSFLVPKSAELKLTKIEVRSLDVLQLPLYVDLRWAVDLAACAVWVFALSEVYAWLLPRRSAAELNLSAVWWALVVGAGLKSLAALSAQYFASGDGEDAAAGESGERSLVLSFGLVTFLASMMLMMVADQAFDVGLLRAYENFTAATDAYLSSQEVDLDSAKRSPILLYLCLSVFFGFLGGLLVFPSFRLARMYSEALGYAESPLTKLVLHLSFFGPLVLVAAWVRELGPLLRLEQRVVESGRMWGVVGLLVLRMLTMRLHLQAYLNSAQAKVERLRTEAGRVNSLALQRMVGRIFAFLCAAALQYVAPLLLILAFLCLRKSLGAYEWLPSETPAVAVSPLAALSPFDVPPKTAAAGSVGESLASLSALFGPIVHRGLWNLLLLNTLIIHAALSAIGLAYNTRVHNA